jgi:hypothetical protein
MDWDRRCCEVPEQIPRSPLFQRGRSKGDSAFAVSPFEKQSLISPLKKQLRLNGTYLSLTTTEKTGFQCLCWSKTTEITGSELSQKSQNPAKSA